MSQQDVRTYPKHGGAARYGIGPVRWTPDSTRLVKEQQLEVGLGGQVYRFSPRDCEIAEALDDWVIVAPDDVDTTPLRRMVWRARAELARLASQWAGDLDGWERDRDHDFVRAETAPAQQATAA